MVDKSVLTTTTCINASLIMLESVGTLLLALGTLLLVLLGCAGVFSVVPFRVVSGLLFVPTGGISALLFAPLLGAFSLASLGVSLVFLGGAGAFAIAALIAALQALLGGVK